MAEDDKSRRRPPPIPQEILDRIKQRPRSLLEAERQVNDMVDKAVVDSLLALAATLQDRMARAVGLIDANKVSEARSLLDAQVVALDHLDIRPMDLRR